MAFDDRFASERIQKETLNLMKFACNHLSIIVELMRSRSHRRWLGPGVAAQGTGSHEDDHVPEVSRGWSSHYL